MPTVSLSYGLLPRTWAISCFKKRMAPIPKKPLYCGKHPTPNIQRYTIKVMSTSLLCVVNCKGCQSTYLVHYWERPQTYLIPMPAPMYDSSWIFQPFLLFQSSCGVYKITYVSTLLPSHSCITSVLPGNLDLVKISMALVSDVVSLCILKSII